MKRRICVLAGLLVLTVSLAACGKKEKESDKETPETEQQVEEVTLAGPEFAFLEMIGKDCQLLPDDVNAEVSDSVVVAIGAAKERIGGVEGTVAYRYFVEDPFITEITWSVTDCEDGEKIKNAMVERYGEPDLSEVSETEDGVGKNGVFTWKNEAGCQIRASIDENPVNGGNATITWSERKADDWSFVEYMGKEITALPTDKVIDMTDGDSGLLLAMEETYAYGISGSVSFCYTPGEDVIRSVVWESAEITRQEFEDMMTAMETAYGAAEQRTNESGQNVYYWADADGYVMQVTDMTFGDAGFAAIRWE